MLGTSELYHNLLNVSKTSSIYSKKKKVLLQVLLKPKRAHCTAIGVNIRLRVTYCSASFFLLLHVPRSSQFYPFFEP